MKIRDVENSRNRDFEKSRNPEFDNRNRRIEKCRTKIMSFCEIEKSGNWEHENLKTQKIIKTKNWEFGKSKNQWKFEKSRSREIANRKIWICRIKKWRN